MIVDFNELVLDVARASAKSERAAGLVIEAQSAQADADADLAVAEARLSRAVAVECGFVPQQPRLDAVAVSRADVVELAAPNVVRRQRHRCSFCRRPGHRIQRCPDVVRHVGAP